MSEPAYADYLSFYRRGPRAADLVANRAAGTTNLRLFDVAHPAGEIVVESVPEFLLIVGYHGDAGLLMDVGAGAWRGRWRPGDIILAPAHAATRYVPDGACRNLSLSIPAEVLQRTLDLTHPHFTDFGRLHAAPFRDLFVETLCRRLWDEVAAGNPYGSLFADGAVLALMATLMRLAGGWTGSAPDVDRHDAPRRLRRALDLVHDRLADDLCLTDLATEAALSPAHFARAFRKATGLPPHAYLQRCRVERAKEMLAGTDLGLTEIAFACGFKSQSHFGQAFRRAVGTTPGAYRRERRR